ncbi:MAG TPA: phosphatidate cytidylyltransferase [Candidatus Barnesiella excrementavium]|nr:phosphatidate cytidylyltransferase [Candidatus Barnesiella excrementavium]
MKNLLTRTFTGILFIAIITAAVLSGAYTFLCIFGLIALLGYIEFLNLTRFGRPFDQALFVIDLAGACALFLSAFTFSGQLTESLHWASILTYLIYLVARPVIQLYVSPDKSPIAGWAYSILGHVYIVLPLALLGVWGYNTEYQLLYGHPEYLLMALFAFIWINDTGAYVVGSTLGRHRLFERISPKKSWEGFFGGLLFCIILAACLNYIIPGLLTTAQWIVMGILTSVFSTWGDLCESLLKRTAGVKDSGRLLPGHGGILDRFDSELLASPMIFIYLTIVL